MRALLGWLRSKGVISKTPLHSLRKEFGSLIHARYGLLAASEQLRHGGIGVTARHYLENRAALGSRPRGGSCCLKNMRTTSSKMCFGPDSITLQPRSPAPCNFAMTESSMPMAPAFMQARNSVFKREDAEVEGGAYRRGAAGEVP